MKNKIRNSLLAGAIALGSVGCDALTGPVNMYDCGIDISPKDVIIENLDDRLEFRVDEDYTIDWRYWAEPNNLGELRKVSNNKLQYVPRVNTEINGSIELYATINVLALCPVSTYVSTANVYRRR